MARQVRTTKQPVQWHFPLTRTNGVLLAIGIAVIAVGYGLMLTAITSDPVKHQEAWNNPLAVVVAPILLVVGYAAIIPVALLYRRKK